VDAPEYVAHVPASSNLVLSDVAEIRIGPQMRRGVKGLKANRTRIAGLMSRSLMLVTALAPKIGYDRATEIAKAAHKNGTTLKQEALRLGYVTEADYDAIVRPEQMIAPK